MMQLCESPSTDDRGVSTPQTVRISTSGQVAPHLVDEILDLPPGWVLSAVVMDTTARHQQGPELMLPLIDWQLPGGILGGCEAAEEANDDEQRRQDHYHEDLLLLRLACSDVEEDAIGAPRQDYLLRADGVCTADLVGVTFHSQIGFALINWSGASEAARRDVCNAMMRGGWDLGYDLKLESSPRALRFESLWAAVEAVAPHLSFGAALDAALHKHLSEDVANGPS